MIVFVVGEVLKLVLVERLFNVSRDKLMSIPAFAWACGKYRKAKDWFESFEVWQTVLHWRRLAQDAVRGYVQAVRATLNLERVTFQIR